jgi:hypothetical protein
MGAADARQELVRDINEAFSAANIGRSAERVRANSPRGDFLDISEALGFLAKLHGGDVARYRRRLTFPPLIRRLLTTAYRAALFNKPNPIPMHIEINPSEDHSVRVSYTGQLISVVLTRPDPTPRGNR